MKKNRFINSRENGKKDRGYDLFEDILPIYQNRNDIIQDDIFFETEQKKNKNTDR